MMKLNASDLLNKASNEFKQLREKMSEKIHKSPLLSPEVIQSLKSKSNDIYELKDDDPNLILSFKCFMNTLVLLEKIAGKSDVLHSATDYLTAEGSLLKLIFQAGISHKDLLQLLTSINQFIFYLQQTKNDVESLGTLMVGDIQNEFAELFNTLFKEGITLFSEGLGQLDVTMFKSFEEPLKKMVMDLQRETETFFIVMPSMVAEKLDELNKQIQLFDLEKYSLPKDEKGLYISTSFAEDSPIKKLIDTVNSVLILQNKLSALKNHQLEISPQEMAIIWDEVIKLKNNINILYKSRHELHDLLENYKKEVKAQVTDVTKSLTTAVEKTHKDAKEYLTEAVDKSQDKLKKSLEKSSEDFISKQFYKLYQIEKRLGLNMERAKRALVHNNKSKYMSHMRRCQDRYLAERRVSIQRLIHLTKWAIPLSMEVPLYTLINLREQVSQCQLYEAKLYIDEINQLIDKKTGMDKLSEDIMALKNKIINKIDIEKNTHLLNELIECRKLLKVQLTSFSGDPLGQFSQTKPSDTKLHMPLYYKYNQKSRSLKMTKRESSILEKPSSTPLFKALHKKIQQLEKDPSAKIPIPLNAIQQYTLETKPSIVLPNSPKKIFSPADHIQRLTTRFQGRTIQTLQGELVNILGACDKIINNMNLSNLPEPEKKSINNIVRSVENTVYNISALLEKLQKLEFDSRRLSKELPTKSIRHVVWDFITHKKSMQKEAAAIYTNMREIEQELQNSFTELNKLKTDNDAKLSQLRDDIQAVCIPLKSVHMIFSHLLKMPHDKKMPSYLIELVMQEVQKHMQQWLTHAFKEQALDKNIQTFLQNVGKFVMDLKSDNKTLMEKITLLKDAVELYDQYSRLEMPNKEQLRGFLEETISLLQTAITSLSVTMTTQQSAEMAKIAEQLEKAQAAYAPLVESAKSSSEIILKILKIIQPAPTLAVPATTPPIAQNSENLSHSVSVATHIPSTATQKRH